MTKAIENSPCCITKVRNPFKSSRFIEVCDSSGGKTRRVAREVHQQTRCLHCPVDCHSCPSYGRMVGQAVRRPQSRCHGEFPRAGTSAKSHIPPCNDHGYFQLQAITAFGQTRSSTANYSSHPCILVLLVHALLSKADVGVDCRFAEIVLCNVPIVKPQNIAGLRKGLTE